MGNSNNTCGRPATSVAPDCIGTVLEPLRERVALDQLHHEEVRAIVLFEAMDRRDVRMVQRGEQLRFSMEARKTLRVVREAFGHNLERDLPIQLRVARSIHLSHPARADLGRHLVDAKADAGTEGQWCCGGLYGQASQRRRDRPN